MKRIATKSRLQSRPPGARPPNPIPARSQAAPELEVRDLLVVRALCETGSTGRAAATLHLTQPAVSRALLSVEAKLGVPLFERGSRGLTPTPACRTLVGEAEPLLDALCALERRIVGADRAAPLELRVVCECYMAYHWLPSALTRLREIAPDIRLSLAIEHTSDPMRGLLAREVDVALLVNQHAPRGAALEEHALFSDEMVFVVAEQHPLAARRALSRDDLLRHKLLSTTPVAGEMSWFLKRVFGPARPRLQGEHLPLTEAVLDMARAGMGIAVVSEWVLGPHLAVGGLVAKRLDAGPIVRAWRLCVRKELGHLSGQLCSILAATAPALWARQEVAQAAGRRRRS